ncbi:MAG: Rossmann-like and DUF2520 domain-containing protein [Candidatus Aminicenantales bacterium]
MADIVLIGAGRLGTSLGLALVAQGYHIKAITCRTLASAKESQRLIGQGLALTDNVKAARLADILFLCLPDEEIPAETGRLARARIDWNGKTAFHTSGLLSAAALFPLRKRGAAVASFHPVQSFPRKAMLPARFKKIYVGIEGDKRACQLAMTLARQLGAHPFLIPAKGKPAYHAACSMASGFLVVLLDEVFRLLRKAGIEEKEARRLLFPLVEGTLQNVKELDTPAALTGPVTRGDSRSVEKHLQALRSRPLSFEAYRVFSLLALKEAERMGLSRPKVRALKNLLEGK